MATTVRIYNNYQTVVLGPPPNLAVILDGQVSGILKPGDALRLQILPGEHRLNWTYDRDLKPNKEVRRKYGKDTRFSIGSGEQIDFEVHHPKWGGLVRTRRVSRSDLETSAESPSHAPHVVGEVEILDGVRVISRGFEQVTIEAGVTVSIRKSDEVDSLVGLSSAGTSARAGFSLQAFEAQVAAQLTSSRSIEYRKKRVQEVTVTLDGNVATAWEVGFEDHWVPARATVDGSEVTFELLVRSNVIARSIRPEVS